MCNPPPPQIPPNTNKQTHKQIQIETLNFKKCIQIIKQTRHKYTETKAAKQNKNNAPAPQAYRNHVGDEGGSGRERGRSGEMEGEGGGRRGRAHPYLRPLKVRDKGGKHQYKPVRTAEVGVGVGGRGG